MTERWLVVAGHSCESAEVDVLGSHETATIHPKHSKQTILAKISTNVSSLTYPFRQLSVIF